MIKIAIGICIGGSIAMMFPEQAGLAYEMIRGTINQGAAAAVEATS